MKKDFGALSFSEKEKICESIYISHGPYWHVYTDGTRMQNIFCCDKDFMTGMWCLAAGVHLCKGGSDAHVRVNGQLHTSDYGWQTRGLH